MLFKGNVGHEALFDEVCKSVELERKTKTLLQSVVKKYKLAKPALIFIEPETLRNAMNDPEFCDDQEELQKLYNSWFTETRKR